MNQSHLDALAERFGVAPGYHGIDGEWVATPPNTKRLAGKPGSSG
jgi:hypothetical protein